MQKAIWIVTIKLKRKIEQKLILPSETLLEDQLTEASLVFSADTFDFLLSLSR